jgi:hypothetical protein
MVDEPHIRIHSIERADGQSISYISPHRAHPIWQLNPKYAEDVRMIAEPIQTVNKSENLRYVLTFPLLKAAKKLFFRGVRSCDSSPFEDRTSDSFKGVENGVWAYVAVYMDDLTPELQRKLRKEHKRYEDKIDMGDNLELGRVCVRNLPTFSGEEIEGAYFEVKISPDITPAIVEQALVELVNNTIPRSLKIKS